MREKFLFAFLILAIALTEAFFNVEAQDVINKAQAVINQARLSIGGEKVKSLNSLSATGNYRRLLGEREMSGEFQIDLLMPDKMMRAETMSPIPNVEITRIEAVNGDRVWTDQQSSGMGGGMIVMRRPGGDTPQAQAMQENAIRAEFARLTIGWLLSTPNSFPVEYAYAGEAEAPDGKADVIDVKGPNGFAARLFLDQKTHKPLMLTFKGRKPRVVMQTVSGPSKSQEEIEKRIKDSEAEAAKQPEVEFQIRFSDYRDVSGVSLPHRLTRSVDGEVNEEWEMSKFKINPSLKPEKFEKK
jgi:hypothetical protein